MLRIEDVKDLCKTCKWKDILDEEECGKYIISGCIGAILKCNKYENKEKVLTKDK